MARQYSLSILLFGATILAAVLVAALDSSKVTFAIALTLVAIAVTHLFIDYRDKRAKSSADRTQRDHEILLESVSHYPMPFALYDENDRLIVWNKSYEAIYANAFSKLQNKVATNTLHYSDLLRGNIDVAMDKHAIDAFVQKRVEEQRNSAGAVYDRNYPDHGWYRVSKHRTPSGAVAGFAIDINEMKQRETQLLEEIEQRKQLELEVRKLAYTDVLTGVANRRSFLETAEMKFEHARKHNTGLYLLMLDIDHFKTINDTFGHTVGDDVLKQVTATTKPNLSSDDLLGRLGGEEFAVLLPHTTSDTAFQCAEDIRNSIADNMFVAANQAFQVTTSIGLSEMYVSDSNFSDILKRADDLLYEAKQHGRNRTIVKTNNLKKRVSNR